MHRLVCLFLLLALCVPLWGCTGGDTPLIVIHRGETAPVTDAAVDSDTPEDTEIRTYVLNKNSGKFHLPDCAGVKTMKAENREDFSGTRSQVIERGYTPCQSCNP